MYAPRRIPKVAIAAVLGALSTAPLPAGAAAAAVPPIPDTTASSGWLSADGPVFPRPGGGPRAIHSFGDLSGAQVYLLDEAHGRYRRLPFARIMVAPRGDLVAVEGVDARVGIADRADLLRRGERAVRWTSLPPGSWAGWSPDGRALLTRAKPVGWYDERTVVALDPDWHTRPVLLLVSIDTGQVIRRVGLPGTMNSDDLQLGSAHELTGKAARYGF